MGEDRGGGLLVEEVAQSRKDVEVHPGNGIHRRTNLPEGDPVVVSAGEYQAGDADLGKPPGDRIGIPGGHETQDRSHVGRIAHEAAVDGPGRGGNP